jgi:hypothetical protein
MTTKKTKTNPTDELRSILAQLNNKNKQDVLDHARQLLTIQRGGKFVIKK